MIEYIDNSEIRRRLSLIKKLLLLVLERWHGIAQVFAGAMTGIYEKTINEG